MGFIPPNTLCVQARLRGVEILPPLQINVSKVDFTAAAQTIRIGLKQVKGIEKSFLDSIIEARKVAPFTSVHDFIYRTHVSKDVAENLILAGGAFDWFSENRRALLWDLPRWYQTKGGGASFWRFPLPGTKLKILPP